MVQWYFKEQGECQNRISTSVYHYFLVVRFLIDCTGTLFSLCRMSCHGRGKGKAPVGRSDSQEEGGWLGMRAEQ